MRSGVRRARTRSFRRWRMISCPAAKGMRWVKPSRTMRSPSRTKRAIASCIVIAFDIGHRPRPRDETARIIAQKPRPGPGCAGPPIGVGWPHEPRGPPPSRPDHRRQPRPRARVRPPVARRRPRGLRPVARPARLEGARRTGQGPSRDAAHARLRGDERRLRDGGAPRRRGSVGSPGHPDQQRRPLRWRGPRRRVARPRRDPAYLRNQHHRPPAHDARLPAPAAQGERSAGHPRHLPDGIDRRQQQRRTLRLPHQQGGPQHGLPQPGARPRQGRHPLRGPAPGVGAHRHGRAGRAARSRGGGHGAGADDRIARCRAQRRLLRSRRAPAALVSAGPGVSCSRSAAAYIVRCRRSRAMTFTFKTTRRLFVGAWLTVLVLGNFLHLFGDRVSVDAVCDVTLIFAGAGLIVYGFKVLREERLIADTPTSRVRSVAMGVAELAGIARQKLPLVSPLTGAGCVYYRYLEDETGRILVDPEGGETILNRAYRETKREGGWLGRRRRYSEWRITQGQPVYVMGTVRKLTDAILERRVRLTEQVQALKRDKGRLMSFDADKDGTISGEEWEAAVRAVQDDLLREQVSEAPVKPEDDVAIGKGDAEKTFVLSDRGESAIVRGMALKGYGSLVGGFGVAMLVSMSLLARTGVLPGHLAIQWHTIFS